MALYTVVTDTIATYTGLSPTAFFTILALMFVTYKMVCGMFVDPEEFDATTKKPAAAAAAATELSRSAPVIPEPVISEPVQLGDVTEEELRAYDGSDPSKPLLMAIKGQIYDVSRSRMFYGPGGPYGMFAGRDASRALALLSFDPKDINGNIEGLNESELEVLQDWEYKFMEKYVKVGQIVSERSGKHTENGGEVPDRQHQEGTDKTE